MMLLMIAAELAATGAVVIVLVPGVVGREELLAQQREQLTSLQPIDTGERSVLAPHDGQDAERATNDGCC